jgi:peroxiredoxin Q/BCP
VGEGGDGVDTRGAPGGAKTLANGTGSMPLEPGDPAPAVTAVDQHGESVTPDFEGTAVIYFYVEDGTPGCATQADQFGLEADTYEAAGVTVYGVSTDGVDSHREFAAERGIDFDLLADPEGELCEAFGVERDHAGRARRTTFVIDDGEVVRTVEGVSPDGHARDLLLELYDAGVVDLDL